MSHTLGLPAYVRTDLAAGAYSDFIVSALAGIADEAAPLVAAESDPERCHAIIVAAIAAATKEKLTTERFIEMLRKTLAGSVQ